MTDPSTPPTTPDDTEPMFDRKTRRGFLELLAVGDFDGLDTIAESTGMGAWRDLALQAIAFELMTTSIAVETDPGINGQALRVIGAMVNGLFGLEMAGEADEILVGCHAAGARMRVANGLTGVEDAARVDEARISRLEDAMSEIEELVNQLGGDVNGGDHVV